MNYAQALDVLKAGNAVTRDGRTYVFCRVSTFGAHDVTDPNEPVRHYFSEKERAAEDWEPVPETIAPEAVDEALHETIPETLGELEHDDDELT